jgi:competence protein ComEA
MNFKKRLKLTTQLLAVVLWLGMSTAYAQVLTRLQQCKLVETEWSDGDSFQIQTADGQTQTLRLYGADCIEWHVNDDTDARRLRAQRRYFGLSESGGSPQASIQVAKEFGGAAAKEVASALRKPFQVDTAFADARGDGKYKRVYAFVTTADGEDLAERLIRLGLARAFGVYRETPTARSANDYRAFLQDVELQSAKRGAGIWAKTNWDSLPKERQAERQEAEELGMATGQPKLQEGKKINPNTAARDELMLLPGIGEVTANSIIQARPFQKIDDLLNVQGIGPNTLERLNPFLQLP